MNYRNPLRAIKGLVPERVDQGVDYSGSGPIYALGNGVVTGILGGWPGGPFIEYRLTDGPGAGSLVYVAENVTARVHVGQHVSSSTVIADMHGGIETGWASGKGSTSLAASHGQQSHHGDPGEVSTAWGESFNKLLHSLGAPAGKVDSKIHGTATAFPKGGGTVSGGGSGGSGGGFSFVDTLINPLAPFLGGFKAVQGTATGVADAASSIGSVVDELHTAMNWISWLFQPSNWLRILAAIVGIGLLATGSIMLVVSAQ